MKDQLIIIDLTPIWPRWSHIIRPNYYQSKDGKDLIERFEDGLLTEDQTRGFLIGNVMKYVTRYMGKNGLEDLENADTYLDRLADFEKRLAKRS